MSAAQRPQELARRAPALDAFRGLVILTMIFVNHIAGFQGLPAWLKHVPAAQEGMTFVDVVFPAFLLAVGLSIPLSLQARGGERAALASILGHTAARCLALLTLGVFMVNASRISEARSGLTPLSWNVLLFLGALLVWLPRAPTVRHRLRQAAGLALLLWLALRYRRDDGAPMRTEWWGILGLIGWCHATGTLVYLLCRQRSAALMGSLGLLIALYQGGRAGTATLTALHLDPLLRFVDLPTVCGSLAAIVVAGSLIGTWLYTVGPAEEGRRSALLFAGGLLLCGALLRPVHGIHKPSGTASWALLSAGASALVFLALERLARTRLAAGRTWRLLSDAGQNALLAYLLPDAVFSALILLDVVSERWLDTHHAAGFAGVLRGLLVSLCLVGLAAALRRRQIVLRL